jgi:hypothetical protein
VKGSCEHGIKPIRTIKCGECDYTNNCYLVNKHPLHGVSYLRVLLDTFKYISFNLTCLLN